jgi:uncharacterized repeat protein (TIGR03803 family)
MIKMRHARRLNFQTHHRLATALTAAVVLATALLGVSAHAQSAKAAKENTLYTFTGGADGGSPYASLIRDAAGNLYGATFAGGAANLGTVFKINKTGKETVLYSFTGTPDGEHVSRNLLRDKAGNLYGVAYEGGASGFGAVFKLDRAGKESILYSFGAGTDGEYPGSGLIADAAGNLYGTTGYGSRRATGLSTSSASRAKRRFCTALPGRTDNILSETCCGTPPGTCTAPRRWAAHLATERCSNCLRKER